jgi:hypothetical protein
MDHVYEVDLANGKTIRVSHREKTGPVMLIPGREAVGGESLGPYTPTEWIAIAKRKDTFLDVNGNTYASSAIVSARLV